VLVYGKYQLLDRENPEAFAYTRSLDGRTLPVALPLVTSSSTISTFDECARMTAEAIVVEQLSYLIRSPYVEVFVGPRPTDSTAGERSAR
jgi:hypothetical protein